MSATTETLRCRWCAAKFLKWRTLRTGRKVNGFTMLKNHIEDYHPEKADEIEAALGLADEDYDDE